MRIGEIVPAPSRSPATIRRLTAALFLVALICALLVGAAWTPPSASAATRTLRISVSRPGTVHSGTRVTIRCRARDQTGRAIRGVRVVFRWRLPEGRRTQTRYTNVNGLATASRIASCGSASEFRARVVVTATWRGQVRQVTRYFTIIGGT